MRWFLFLVRWAFAYKNIMLIISTLQNKYIYLCRAIKQ